jgi:hypothetical protein
MAAQSQGAVLGRACFSPRRYILQNPRQNCRPRAPKLDSDLEVPLVVRGHRFLGLTSEGESVLTWQQL